MLSDLVIDSSVLQLKEFCERLYLSGHVKVVDLNGAFVGQCLDNPFKARAIKTSDWIVAMTAYLHKGTLITWDKGLMKNCKKIIAVANPD